MRAANGPVAPRRSTPNMACGRILVRWVVTGSPWCRANPRKQGVHGEFTNFRSLRENTLSPATTLVRDTGIEPVTSSVSGKRSPAELIARGFENLEVETGIEPVCTALQAVASPLGHSTAGIDASSIFERMTGFEPATLTLAR